MKAIYFFIILSAIAGICINADMPRDETRFSVLNSNYHGTGIYEVGVGGFPAINEKFVGVLDIINYINTSSGIFRICIEEVA